MVGTAYPAPAMKLPRLLACCFFSGLVTCSLASPVPYRTPAQLPDRLETVEPSAVHVDGWLGHRLDVNVRARLAVLDTAPLTAGFKVKPGEHPWIGEHAGKWLHAATLAWAYTGDAALRQKLDGVAAELVAAQEPDGYLGTYVPAQRFGLYQGADWDVWSHKYNLLGLLTYYRYTGNEAALHACRRIGDLLIATFPAKKSILAAGTHEGMAATSVLEPMVLLYRLTGDERYLEFARYVVRAYDEPGGPGIVRSLLAGRGVNQTANGKAYEMLSNLVGLCEYARATGDPAILQAALGAWTDIVERRLYATGTASSFELFGGDHELPNGEDAHAGETCVTTTWIQFNAQLLRLTGEARFADEIERSLYNHLTAAQNPRGDDWCYYTALEGVKHYDHGITCCHSSGPRGLALAPTLAYLTGGNTLYVSTLETSRAQVELGGGPVEIEQQSEFPRRGQSALILHLAAPRTFALKIRTPAWAAPLSAGALSRADAGWLELPAREWHDGDRVELTFTLQGRLLPGTYTNYARAAAAWGPFLLALDRADNPKLDGLSSLRLMPGAIAVPAGESLRFATAVRGTWDVEPRPAILVPFAEAGAGGSEFRVWLRSATPR